MAKMANKNLFHCSIKIISRSKGQSAVASAAYRAGAKLQNEETGKINNYTKKQEVVHSEIMLPKNAPPEYADRETLWNAVQQIENKANSTLAREIEVALPLSMTHKQRLECLRNYIKENFITKGMIADFNIHDKVGNPHAHIMLTCRGFDGNKKWAMKSKSVYANAIDDNGKPIFDPNKPCYNPKDKANTEQYKLPMLDPQKLSKWEAEHNRKFDLQKDRKDLDKVQAGRERKGKGTEWKWYRVNVDMTNDWDEHKNAEIWRKSWADYCNKYLEDNKKIDHRSYKRQGLDTEPTIHEGHIARKIERKGGVSDRCKTNREIEELNEINAKISNLSNNLAEEQEINKILAMLEQGRIIKNQDKYKTKLLQKINSDRREISQTEKIIRAYMRDGARLYLKCYDINSGTQILPKITKSCNAFRGAGYNGNDLKSMFQAEAKTVKGELKKLGRDALQLEINWDLLGEYERAEMAYKQAGRDL